MPKTDITVRELVDKVRRGELVLPEMQRRYVWPATRVRDLLDSLYRGYPSGTILVWETDDEIETRSLSVAPTTAPAGSTRLLLLDGQQRTTSLAAILSGQAVTVRNRKRPINILFNLDHPEGPPAEVIEVDEADTGPDIEEIGEAEPDDRDIQEELRRRTFVVASRALQNDPTWVPVTDVFLKSDRDILKRLGINSDDDRWDRYSDRLQRIRRIQDYPYVMQLLDKGMSYEEVTEIFVRVNSLGAKLRGSDLALAQITSKWKGFMQEVEEYVRQFGADEDYIFETGLPVRTLVVFATGQARFRTVGRLGEGQLKEAWKSAQAGLEFAVNFVRSNAKVEHLSHLSSPFLLVPIAVYAVRRKGKLKQADTRALLRWFYLAHMRGHYGMGSSETILDGDLAILFRDRGIDALLSQLRLHVKRLELAPEEVAGKGIRSPIFTMLYLVLRQAGAQDWLSGLALSERHVGKSHAIQFHHIFPKSLLRKAGYDQREINQIANLAFIGGKTNRHITNKEPSQYFKSMVIPRQGEASLRSQLIPLDPGLWTVDAYRRFAEERTRAIAESINDYLGRFA